MKDYEGIQRAQDKARERFEIEDKQQIDSAIENLMEHASGRKFLWWLLSLGNLGGNPFNGHALGTSFNCGELNVSQKILDRLLEVNPQGYAQMVTENADEQQRRDTIIARAGDDAGDEGESGDSDSDRDY